MRFRAGVVQNEAVPGNTVMSQAQSADGEQSRTAARSLPSLEVIPSVAAEAFVTQQRQLVAVPLPAHQFSRSLPHAFFVFAPHEKWSSPRIMDRG